MGYLGIACQTLQASQQLSDLVSSRGDALLGSNIRVSPFVTRVRDRFRTLGERKDRLQLLEALPAWGAGSDRDCPSSPPFDLCPPLIWVEDQGAPGRVLVITPGAHQVRLQEAQPW